MHSYARYISVAIALFVKREYDLAIIGCGIVGLMIAYELALISAYNKDRSEKRISCICIDKENGIAKHASSRNSGVIHSGIHAKPNTLKARLCVKGNKLMYKLCSTLNIPYRRGGMLIVANSNDEEKALSELERRARANSVEYEIVHRDRIKVLEPYAKASIGVYVPSAGITDPYAIAYAVHNKALENGIEFMFNSKVTRIDECNGMFKLIVNNDKHKQTVSATIVINSAGLHADEIAMLVGLNRYKVYPCLGEYYIIKGKPYLVNSLIYPVPTFDYKGIGIHLTKRLDNSISIGPNAVYLKSKDEVYTSGMDEFYKHASMLVEGVSKEDLVYGYSGVRARLVGYGSKEEADFVIEEYPHNFIHLLGIESPGFTSSPAIAKYVLEMLKDRLVI